MFTTPEWENDVPDVKHKKLKNDSTFSIYSGGENKSEGANQPNNNDTNNVFYKTNEKTSISQNKNCNMNIDVDTLRSIYNENNNTKVLNKTNTKKIIKNITATAQRISRIKQTNDTSNSIIFDATKNCNRSELQKKKDKKRKHLDDSLGHKKKVKKMDSTQKVKHQNCTKLNKLAANSNEIKSDASKNISNINDSEQINITIKSETNKSNETKTIIKPKHLLNKKEKFKQLLDQDHSRTFLKAKDGHLRNRMMEKLKAAQFRYLNERLYTSSGDDARQLFTQDPSAFKAYHIGFQHQLSKWPLNPLDLIIKRISKMSKNITVADMGCGDATLSRRVPQTVRSFELVANAPGVEACDMAHTPLSPASIDVVVYCLALMGTNLTEYLLEANRVLKTGGLLLIAEVESRFDDVDIFGREVQRLGFKLTKLDTTHKMFVFFDFKKIQSPPTKKGKLPNLTLKPCLYKRR